MDSHHKKYIIGEQGIGCAIINFIFGGAGAYFLARSLPAVPMWGSKPGDTSISGDILGTALILTFLVSVIITAVTRKKIKDGQLLPISWRRSSHSLLRLLPANNMLRGLLLGVVFMVILAPIAIFALSVFNVNQMSLWPYITFKASFSAVNAALIGPLAALCAMGDA